MHEKIPVSQPTRTIYIYTKNISPVRATAAAVGPRLSAAPGGGATPFGRGALHITRNEFSKHEGKTEMIETQQINTCLVIDLPMSFDTEKTWNDPRAETHLLV